MPKFSNKLKKPFLAHFWPTFIISGAKFFSQKIQLCHTTSHGILAPCQISEKTNDRIPRKHLDRGTDRPYFIGPF